MKPITRWNRAGLPRFSYIHGNAPSFFAEMMAQYRTRLLARQTAALNQEDAPDQAALLYNTPDTEWGARILRSFARSSHVLTEHINDFANEMTVPTAGQWESLRKLAGMVNYLPAPPASAATDLSLTVKVGKKGTVKRGLQVKQKPGIKDPLVFETTADLQVDACLNQFFAKDHDICPAILKGSEIALEGRLEDLKASRPVLIADEENGKSHAAVLQSVLPQGDTTVLRIHPALPAGTGIRKGRAVIHCNPEVAATLTGPASGRVSLKQAFMLKEKPDLVRGDIVVISDGSRTRFAKVRKVDGHNVAVDADTAGGGPQWLGSFDSPRTYVSKALEVSISGVWERAGKISTLMIPGDWTWLAGSDVADVKWLGQGRKFQLVQGARVTGVDYQPPGKASLKKYNEGYSYVRVSHADMPGDFLNPQRIVVVPRVQTWKLDRFLDQLTNTNGVGQFECTPEDKIVSNAYGVIRRKNQLCWGRIHQLSRFDGVLKGVIESPRAWGGGLYYLAQTTLYTAFKKQLRCQGWQRNDTVLDPGCIVPHDPGVLDALSLNRPLFVKTDSAVHRARVSKIDREAGCFSLTVSGPAPTGTFINYSTSFAGNVCKVFHGSQAPSKIFSSGDECVPWFTIPLDVTDISYVSNTGFSTGVAADIEVVVHGETWRQVEQLTQSGNADCHYVARLQADGSLKICFGDGIRGKMIPPGVDNIQITFRRGNGLPGNCDARTLEKPAAPHPLIESVEQPFPAFGGNRREPEDSLRTHIADKLFAMDRAVSVDDFTHLASLHSAVWQAVAREGGYTSARARLIHVVVVPAGGTALHPDLKKELRLFLESRSIPGIIVRVDEYVELNPLIEVDLFVNSARFDPHGVKDSARTILAADYGLENARLGQPLGIGGFYKRLEALEGVEHAKVKIDGRLLQSEFTVGFNEIACLDRQGNNLEIRTMEYSI
ncbi:MAG: hypothetical protein MI799_11645 [Desulfobacterales bacterium]|nr:hypothetical protein [Desulfobacterales bacterium]